LSTAAFQPIRALSMHCTCPVVVDMSLRARHARIDASIGSAAATSACAAEGTVPSTTTSAAATLSAHHARRQTVAPNRDFNRRIVKRERNRRSIRCAR
jgi:hypothetical protein